MIDKFSFGYYKEQYQLLRIIKIIKNNTNTK